MDKEENNPKMKATVKFSEIDFTPILFAVIAVIVSLRMYNYAFIAS